jgi:GDP-mannose 6-dehydrogenase
MPLHAGIFGLGYVGLSTSACLLEKHIRVDGYEISEAKRASLNRLECPLTEPGVEAVIHQNLLSGQFRVLEDVDIQNVPDLIFVCVGTPSNPDGSTDLRAVQSVFRQLERLVETFPTFLPEIILRSTIPPGTLLGLQNEFPGLFGRCCVVHHPEFLREGTAMHDFIHPPMTVIGTVPQSLPPDKIRQLFNIFDFEYETVSSTEAELLKYACNSFHALKVCFANEMGRISSAFGANGSEIMRLFANDRQLNISEKYLRPGNPYGGSCLPKDNRSLVQLGESSGLSLDLLKACTSSNRSHLRYIVEKIKQLRPTCVALLGLSFKMDTDDLRESPSLDLLGLLSEIPGLRIQIHDFIVRLDHVFGANEKLARRVADQPNCSFHQDLAEALAGADLILIMHQDTRYQQRATQCGGQVLDVAGWNGL